MPARRDDAPDNPAGATKRPDPPDPRHHADAHSPHIGLELVEIPAGPYLIALRTAGSPTTTNAPGTAGTERRGGDSNPRWTDSPYRFSRPAHSTALPPLRWGRPKGSARPGRERRGGHVGTSAGGGRRTSEAGRRPPRPAARFAPAGDG